jgi:hypothetical protein
MIMRTLLASVVALGAFTSAAFAEPLVLSSVQMDSVTAGQMQSNTASVDVTQSNTFTGPSDGDVTQTNDATVTISQSNAINPPPANGG